MIHELKELNSYLKGLQTMQDTMEKNSETFAMIEFEILKVLIKINRLEKQL